MSAFRPTERRVEALAEVASETNQLNESLRRQVARVVLELHGNPHHGELMGDKPPRVLEGCRKIRFDEPGWNNKPRYRFVYRNEPIDGAPATSLIVAIGRRDRMIAYAKAARRVKELASEEGRST